MRVRYTATARDETDDILSQIAGDNPAAATAVGAAIKAAIARLGSFPRIGARTSEPGVSGYFSNDRTYSSGGRALDRATVRSFG